MGPYKRKREAGKSVSEWGSERENWSAIAGFEDGGRVLWAKGYEQLLEAGKCKEMDSPLETTERSVIMSTPWF